MKIGITLPQFRDDPADALAAASAAEQAGLDGVFVFDHLWAIGQPDRPALNCWPLLGALAARTDHIALGTLVARVSLVPDAVLAHQFETLARIAATATASGTPRVIAGLGTGDRLSEPENVAYGIPFPSREERLARLADCARRTKALGLETWIGGRSQDVRDIAIEGQADALNLWDASPTQVADSKGKIAVTWGGVTPDDPEVLGRLLRDLREAGAQWAVCGPRYRQGEPAQAVAVVAEAISLAT